jgi:hypothetical protein
MPVEDLDTTKDDMELLDEALDDVVEEKPSEKPKVSPKTPDVEEEDEPETDDEVEEEILEGDEAPKLDDFTHQRPPVADIKKAYPDIFKKFPSLEHMYFREKEFSELFPTVDDAREASESAEAFSSIRNSVLSGNNEPLIEAIKDTGTKELNKFASNFLPQLFKVDRDAHWTATAPILQSAVRGLFSKGVKEKDENLQHSARYMAEYLFGEDGAEVAEGKKSIVSAPTTSEESEDVKAVRLERQALKTERFDSFVQDTSTDLVSQITSIVIGKDAEGKTKLDPDELMSPLIRKYVMKEIREELDRQLAADPDHIRLMKSLWKKAEDSGYSKDSKTKILSAYLARAKSLVPAIRAKAVSEATGTKLRTQPPLRREPGSSGRSSRGGSRGPIDPKQVDYRKTSDMDLLNDNITYKK